MKRRVKHSKLPKYYGEDCSLVGHAKCITARTVFGNRISEKHLNDINIWQSRMTKKNKKQTNLKTNLRLQVVKKLKI